MRRLRHKDIPFEILAAGSKSTAMSFSGRGAAFNNVDGYGEIIAPGAFMLDLPKFLAEGFIGGLNHDWNRPIGKPTSASEDDRGLNIAARLEARLSHAVECHTLMKSGICKKLSIGFTTLAREYLETPEAVLDYWKGVGYTPSEADRAAISHGAVLLKRIRLYEVSPVMRPANEQADITDVKRDKGGLGFDDHLRAVMVEVEDVCDRAVQVARVRATAKRSLPADRRAVLRAMRDRLDEALKATELRPGATASRELEADLLQLGVDLAEVGIVV